MSKKGFTVLELLVVIAIIGILSTVVLAMISSSRTKGKTAAFKSEVDAILPTLISACHDRALVASDIPGGSTYSAFGSNPATQSCGGVDGQGTFTIEIESTNSGACTSATLTEAGVSYTPSDC